MDRQRYADYTIEIILLRLNNMVAVRCGMGFLWDFSFLAIDIL